MFQKSYQTHSRSHTQTPQAVNYLYQLKKKYTQGQNNVYQNQAQFGLEYTSNHVPNQNLQNQYQSKRPSELKNNHSSSCFRQKLDKIQEQHKLQRSGHNNRHAKSKSVLMKQASLPLKIKKENNNAWLGRYSTDKYKTNQHQSLYNQQRIYMKLKNFKSQEQKKVDSPIKLIYDDFQNQQNMKQELVRHQASSNKLKYTPKKDQMFRQNINKKLQEQNYHSHKPYRKQQNKNVIANIQAIMENIRKTLRN